MSKAMILLSLFGIAGSAWWGCTISAQEPRSGVGEEARQIRIEAFVRSDLPAAALVEAYLTDLPLHQPGLEVVVHDVLKDREQLVRLNELTKKFGRTKAVVPSFYCCNRMYFGFASAEKTGDAIDRLRTVDVYSRATCSRCQAAKGFLAQLNVRWPGLRIVFYDVDVDGQARVKWEQLCRATNQIPGLPTIDFAGQVLVGYQGDDLSGAEFERLIERVAGTEVEQPQSQSDADETPRRRESNDDEVSRFVRPLFPNLALVSMLHQSPEAKTSTTMEEGVLAESQDDELLLPSSAEEIDMGEGTRDVPQDDAVASSDGSILLPYFGTVRVTELGLPAFTLAVGLVDGFNPCAMWVLVFLLSVLVNIRDRRKIVLIAGTFVVVSGLAYFAFMAAWLNLFMLIGIARPAQIALGVMAIFIGVINIKDFIAFKKGFSLSIPESSKPGLYRRVRQIVNAKYMTGAIAGVVVLAVVVNMVELLCTAGLPALYTQILTIQKLPAWENYLYLGLYIAAYMLDDALLLSAVVLTLSHRRMQEREGQWLKLLSGLVIFLLGSVMIFRPSWLQLAY